MAELQAMGYTVRRVGGMIVNDRRRRSDGTLVQTMAASHPKMVDRKTSWA